MNIVQRAKIIARLNMAEAISLLMSIGVALNEAAHFLLRSLRRARVAA